MTQITVRGVTATIQRGVWSTNDPLLAVILPALVPPDLSRQYVPDRDLAYARFAVAQLGGAVTQQSPLTARPGVVY